MYKRQGEFGYSLATFQVAVRWLLGLRWDELEHRETAGAAASQRAANHQQAPHHNKRGAAGRLNKGARAAPAPKQYAHPSIADSMQLLRDLEAELPVGAAKKGSDEEDDEDEVETPPLATKPPLPPMTPSFAADVEKQAEQLRDSSLRDLLACLLYTSPSPRD